MIERRYFGGPLDFHCDSCPAGIETGMHDFAEALASVKEDGWRVRRIGREWVHFCPDCEVPT